MHKSTKKDGLEIRKSRGIPLEDGKLINGSEKLILKTDNRIQQYYRMAINNNAGKLEKMKRAIWVMYFQQYSTDRKPCHGLCYAFVSTRKQN